MPKRNRILQYNPKLRARARELRKNGTLSEVLLWKAIQKKALGFEFHRQVPIAEYIVDFFCHELMLAIEIDGCSHDDPESAMKDAHRQGVLESLGVRFLRFTEADVREDAVWVAQEIQYWIEDQGE